MRKSLPAADQIENINAESGWKNMLLLSVK